MLTPAAALKDIAGFAAANRFRLTAHAVEEADEANLTYRDIRHGLMTATSAVLQANGRWLLKTKDLSGEAFKVVCVFEQGVLVVTVM
jgi:hypothetical protein